MHYFTIQSGIQITCEILKQGNDWNIAIFGGDRPHIGSVVLAVPRMSLTGNGMSATSSVMNCIGHKDEAIAREWAEDLVRITGNTVVCVCGIHVDHITDEKMKSVKQMTDHIKKQVIEELMKEK